MIARPRASRPLRASISSRASPRTTRNLIGLRFFAASASSLDTGRFFEETWPPKRPARGEVAGGAATASRSVIRPCDNPKEGKQGPPGKYSVRGGGDTRRSGARRGVGRGAGWPAGATGERAGAACGDHLRREGSKRMTSPGLGRPPVAGEGAGSAPAAAPDGGGRGAVMAAPAGDAAPA